MRNGTQPSVSSPSFGASEAAGQAAVAGEAVLLTLRRRLFDHTQRLSLEFHEQYTSGRIIARQTSDLESIRDLLDQGLNELVRGILFMAFTGVAMMLLDPVSGLVLAIDPGSDQRGARRPRPRAGAAGAADASTQPSS